ncbi:MAG: hypothetical protein K0B11_17760 [Mariniphaga sp.]|nr:hypothetical protein [Mariniphaga sp.]
MNNDTDITLFLWNWKQGKLFQHYIKPGKIDIKYSQLYSDLFDWRQKGDYNDFFDLSEEEVIPLIEPVEELMRLIKSLPIIT